MNNFYGRCIFMKFCMVLEFFVPHYNGGGERRFYEMSKRLIKLGHSVDILTMKFEENNNYENIEGINVHHIGPVIDNPPIRTKGQFIRYFFSVCNWLRKHDYDIVDAQAYSPLISSVIMSKLYRFPVIGTIYDTSTNSQDQWVQSSKIAKIAETRLVKLPFDNVLTISEATKNSLINDFGVKKEQIKLIYIGVDLERMDSVECSKKDENTILFVGRLVPHKHADHLLEILNNLKDEVPNIKLTIVGKGIEKENLLKYIKQNQLEGYVEFLEDLSNDELTYQMKKSNVLVLPSTREGFGMVLTEANTCYTPVVAYASGGVVEVVEDNVSGYLIEPENIQELEEKIKFILTNKEEQERLSISGREYVEEKFNWDVLIEQYIDFCQEVIKER